MADGCCVDWSFNQRVDIHNVFVTIRVCRDRPLLCQSRQPPTCFSGLCKPHWGYSRACHGRTKSQDRLRTFLSLDLDVFVFSCIFIFFRAILRFSYIIFIINITTGGSEPPRVTYGSSNTETRQELHGRRWSDGRKGMLALHRCWLGAPEAEHAP